MYVVSMQSKGHQLVWKLWRGDGLWVGSRRFKLSQNWSLGNIAWRGKKSIKLQYCEDTANFLFLFGSFGIFYIQFGKHFFRPSPLFSPSNLLLLLWHGPTPTFFLEASLACPVPQWFLHPCPHSPALAGLLTVKCTSYYFTSSTCVTLG